ncbi:hypothetical protein GCM10025867_03410 [Frondihabitans sucicola]|uniref:Uncharacterized protein n=1 Tax=Frondihabitans sucicola TaxID=1268041 RepID=A0ABN6XSZ5_9MICO|nr:hypothetical protein GCM10025867_03410 [Frondihabitans sucicola]
MRRAERDDGVAVGEQEERDFGALEELLDQDRAVLQPVRRVLEGGVAVVRDEHALARGETVGLDDVGGAELVERGGGLGQVAGADGAAGGHARFVHDPLGEGLGALERRGALAGAEDGDAVGAQDVGDAGDEWGLGTHDDELDVVLERVLRHDLAVGRVEVDHFDVGCQARVAGGGDDVVPCAFAEESRDDGVLASTGTEDENAHPRILSSPP